MHLVKTEFEHIKTLMTWFPDKESSYFWCGSGLRYPFTEQTFIEDMRWSEMPSYSLINDEGELVGFGQYYKKLERCHLARLVISPLHRSKGLGHSFIKDLMEIGMADLNLRECSLFVLSNNGKAITCYKSLNFIMTEYPKSEAYFSDISFMVSTRAS